MSKLLLGLTLSIAMYAGPILSVSGSGVEESGIGIGNPLFQFQVAGTSCDEDGPLCYGTMGDWIDGVYFPPGDFRVTLQPVGGLQFFWATGSYNGVTASQEYETWGTVLAVTNPYYGVTQTTLRFDPVPQTNGLLFLTATVTFPTFSASHAVVAAPVPEASPLWLVLIGLVAVVAVTRRHRG